MGEFTITKPDDFHLHLRQGDVMSDLVREAAKVFQRVLVMPNTLPPVTLAEELVHYRSSLEEVGTDLEFLMTYKILPKTTAELVRQLKQAGAIAGKLYPVGVTTNAEDGVTNIRDSYEVFEAMQELDIVLCLHGEVPGVEDVLREEVFLPELKKMHENFPKLRIVMEHVSTKAAVQMVQSLGSTVAATITVHHLLLTTADVRNGHFNPHHYCAPICKSEADRSALAQAVLSGDPKFFFGSDSAPHPMESKQGDHPKPGIFSTPVALPLLAELFEQQDQLKKLEAFTSEFGANFYQLSKNSSSISLKKEAWTVPNEYFGIIPLRAGKNISWNLTANSSLPSANFL